MQLQKEKKICQKSNQILRCEAYVQIKELATKTVEAYGGVKILGNNSTENKQDYFNKKIIKIVCRLKIKRVYKTYEVKINEK